MRIEYKMTEAQFRKILEASNPILVGGGAKPPRESANDAWIELGKELGFVPSTVRPVHGKGKEYFTAEPIDAPLAGPLSIQFTLKEAQTLVEFFGGEDVEVVVMCSDGHSGPGLYAFLAEHPDEGSVFLGDEEQEEGR